MSPHPPSRHARYAGLDGLRAVAVVLVVAYHLFPSGPARGGFVGVDVFFVLSGFLITSLLMTERDDHGRVSLRRFWARRARRLLPALVLMVTVCATLAWAVGGDVLARIGRQILGAAVFGYNWVSLTGGADYFSAGTPELFRNLWSLAVEEQFYLVWPLLLPLVLRIRARRARVGLVLAAAAASAIWMTALAARPGSLTRAYFGTDSHAFGLLIGVALALALHAVLRAPASGMSRPAVRAGSALAGTIAVVGIVVVAAQPPADAPTTFPGALLLACALAALAITAGVWPGSWFGRALDVAPLRWVGERSYGLYLWHWPLLVIATTGSLGVGPEAGVPVGIGLIVLASTIVAAALSYRWVEQPVRRHGFRGCARRVWRALRSDPARRFGVLAASAAAALVLGGTTAAIASAPVETSAESAVHAGADALRDRGAAAPVPAPSETPRDPTPAPSPTPIDGTEVTAVGDSVMLASAPALIERLPGIQIDAAVSRSMSAGPGILEELAASGQLRRYVVVALGTNGAIDPASLERMSQVIGPDRELVLVTAYAPRDWIPGVNGELMAYAHTRDRVELADWSRAIAPHLDLLAGDQVHPGAEGGRVFADTVADALDTVEAMRAAMAYHLELRAYLLNRGIRPLEPH